MLDIILNGSLYGLCIGTVLSVWFNVPSARTTEVRVFLAWMFLIGAIVQGGVSHITVWDLTPENRSGFAAGLFMSIPLGMLISGIIQRTLNKRMGG